MLLTIYLTGLIICIFYDLTLKLSGFNPYGKLNKLEIILDLLCWPSTVPSAFILSILLYKKNKSKKDTL